MSTGIWVSIITISDIADMVAEAVGQPAKPLVFDEKPDGTPIKRWIFWFCRKRDGCPKFRCVTASRKR